MCGIAGLFDPGGAADPAALTAPVARITAALAHRGPDGEGAWTDGRHCALGHRRLAVIDLTPAAAQPMADESGRFHLTYNGELYNFRELRRALEARGRHFRTASDTEVVLAAFDEYGEDAFSRFDGMYALALYDARERRLLLARDPAGEKPLYYAARDGRIFFSSELRPLAGEPGVAGGLSAWGVYCYLALRYVPAPDTILEGVRALEPGTLLAVDRDGAVRTRAFFAFDRAVDPLPQDAAAAAERLEDALAASIERRLVSDVPLGAWLSSGLDSGLVCAIAAKRLGRELKTWCAGFADGGEDETAAARRVAQALGLPHEAYRISAGDLVSTIPGFGRLLDEPNGDRSCVPTYLLAREMRRGVTVALSGDGGDELFCGYRRYEPFGAPAAPADYVARYLDERLRVFAPRVLDTLFPDEAARWRSDFLALYAPAAMRASWSDAQRLSTIDFQTYLPGAVLAKVDRMSMRHALEVRCPYLAPEVIALASGLPTELCTDPHPVKPLLRSVLARYLPADLLPRAKAGFGMPPAFMQAHRAAFMGAFEAAVEGLASEPFFADRPGALRALAQAAPGNVNSLWALTVLGQWAGSMR